MTKRSKFDAVWEVFDLTLPFKNNTIGYVIAPSYALANADAFKKYQKPIDVCYHDRYTILLRENNLWSI